MFSLASKNSTFLFKKLEVARYRHSSKIFFIYFRIWLLYQTLILIPFHDEIWSINSVNGRGTFEGSILDYFLKFSIHDNLEKFYWLFILSQLAAILLSFLSDRFSTIMKIVIYITTMNVYALSGSALDGGSNLSQLLLFYFIFIETRTNENSGLGSPQSQEIRNVISNLFLFLCQFQIAVMYATASLYKVNGDLWQNGMAIYYIFQNDSFTMDFLKQITLQIPWISVIATYITIVFQLLFPVLIWNKRAKFSVMVLGLGIHLSIAIGMGIFTFGTIMCLSYLLFITDIELDQFKKKFRVVAAFDDNCQMCQRFARILLKISFIEIEKDSATRPRDKILSAVEYRDRLEKIYIKIGTKRVLFGFEAIDALISRTFLLPLWKPIGIILRVSGIGELIYIKIASSRFRTNCRDGICSRR